MNSIIKCQPEVSSFLIFKTIQINMTLTPSVRNYLTAVYVNITEKERDICYFYVLLRLFIDNVFKGVF